MSGSLLKYIGYITSEHNQQPDFVQSVTVSVQPFVDDQNVVYGIPALYDLDYAVGAQLDVDGIWIGESRILRVPLPNTYFSWGTAGLGWAQGSWKGPFDPTQGLVMLDDPTYRLLLRAKIAANMWDGTIPSAIAALADIFNPSITPGTTVIVQNTYNMTMTFALSGKQPSAVIQALFGQGYSPLRPVGVDAKYVINSIDNTPVFGWGIDNGLIGGWGHGSWPKPL